MVSLNLVTLQPLGNRVNTNLLLELLSTKKKIKIRVNLVCGEFAKAIDYMFAQIISEARFFLCRLV